MTIGGRLSVAAFSEKDEDFANAIRCGLTWEVLSWKVREFYPDAVTLISEARNIGGQVNRRENEIEVVERKGNANKIEFHVIY